MSIRFHCQHCNTAMSAADRLAGAKVKCKKCGQGVVVPQAAEPRSTGLQSTGLQSTAAFLEDDENDEPPFDFGRRRDDEKEEENEVDMTPMVDVTFLLLIFFMVTAAFHVEAAFTSPAREQEEAASQAEPLEELIEDPDNITVFVNSDNTYRVRVSFWNEEKDAPSDQEMRVKLREARRGPGGGARPPNKLLIMASANARNDKVIKVYDEGNELEMESIRIEMVDEDEDY